MRDIDTGVKTLLFPTYIDGTATAYHISGKAFSRPGWVLMSTYARFGAEKWLHERIMAIELKANPRIINLAHHHSHYQSNASRVGKGHVRTCRPRGSPTHQKKKQLPTITHT